VISFLHGDKVRRLAALEERQHDKVVEERRAVLAVVEQLDLDRLGVANRLTQQCDGVLVVYLPCRKRQLRPTISSFG
jgi:hypothetical protein